MQFGWSLPLIFNPHAKRPLEAQSRIDDVLGNLAPDNPLLGRVPHPQLTARDIGGAAMATVEAIHAKQPAR